MPLTLVPAPLTTYSRPNLPRWQRKLRDNPTAAKMVLLGDSTSYEPNAGHLYSGIRPLSTVAAANSVNSATLTLDAAVGGTSEWPTSGTGYLSGVAFTYTGVTATSFTGCGNHAATVGGERVAQNVGAVGHTAAGGGLEGMTPDATHIINGGNNGLGLQGWLANSGGTYTQANLWADAPDLVILSFGINDVRLGLRTRGQFEADMRTAVALIQTNLPNADIVLRVPNPFTTTNTANLNFVQSPPGTINPPGAAQFFTDLLRAAYLALATDFRNIVVADVQANVLGTVSLDISLMPLFTNQVHPNPTGYTAIANYLVNSVIGLPLADRSRHLWGAGLNPTTLSLT